MVLTSRTHVAGRRATRDSHACCSVLAPSCLSPHSLPTPSLPHSLWRRVPRASISRSSGISRSESSMIGMIMRRETATE